MLKVAVLGYGELAQSIALGVLSSRHALVGVMRWHKDFLKDIFMPEPLLSIIRASNIREIRAKRANTKKFIKEIKKLQPDVIIVGAWGEIIKKELFKLPRVAFINCHPSLLPKHRGCNPYTSVIRQKETETGVTFHLMAEKIDAGDILTQGKVAVSEHETGASIRLKCALKAREMVAPLLDGLEAGKILPVRQNEAEASYYPPLSEEDLVINWNSPAEHIYRQIRSLCPEMCCYTMHKNVYLPVKTARIADISEPTLLPGTIIEKNRNNILVATGEPDKALLLKDFQASLNVGDLLS